MDDVVSCDGEPLPGKQPRKDLLDMVPPLQLVVGIEDHRLDQGLGLLATRFPNGFDGQASFRQWGRETIQVQERIGDEHQTPMVPNGFGAPHPILVQAKVALVAPHLSVVMRQPLWAAGWCRLVDARAASAPPRLEAELGTAAIL